jgi:Sortase domain
MQSLHVRKPSKKIRQIFLFIGVPIVSMCLTFISLYVFARAQYSAPPVVARVDEVQGTKTITPISPPVVEAGEVQGTKTITPISPPVRLVVVTIGVDTIIRPAGLTSDSDMAISDNPDEVAWYQLGTKPGQQGSAVIAGHYGWKAGHGSVFNNLHLLGVGDKVSTYDDKGVATNFIVREIHRYDLTADATEVFKSTDGGAHLNLITCDGTWIQSKDSYSGRLVVFTDLEKN